MKIPSLNGQRKSIFQFIWFYLQYESIETFSISPRLLKSLSQECFIKIQYMFWLFYFIVLDCTFNVEIIKGPRGLGLSVSGGIDSSAPYPGLVRIKRLFPHQAAWATGKLQPGDILLEANGIILTGLTNNVSKEHSVSCHKLNESFY